MLQCFELIHSNFLFVCLLHVALKNEYFSQVELEVEQNVLTTKVNLTDGSMGHVFSRNPNRNDAQLLTYNCHICSVPNLPGERCLYTHISGRRHQQRLANQPFNASLFRAPLHRSNKSTLSLLIVMHLVVDAIEKTKSIHSLLPLSFFHCNSTITNSVCMLLLFKK